MTTTPGGKHTVAGPALHWGSVWDTRDVDGTEAFDYYRDGICQSFMELLPELEAVRRRHFKARVESHPLGEGAVNRVDATAHLVLRTGREIARSPRECYYLNLQRGGECRIDQAGTEIALRAGDVGIFDSGRPFSLEHRRLSSLAVSSFWVPKEALAARLGGRLPERPRLLSFEPALGRLIAETARSIDETAGHLPEAASARLFSMLLDLTAMVLGGEGVGVSRTSRADAQLLALRCFVERNFADPRLDAARCARAMGISPRYVQKLFARAGTTLGAFVMEVRLGEAACALRAPAKAGLPVTSIAYACGFSDLSHFSRSFRARYGAPPGAWRRLAH
ncbi:helix-turn-helix domain-containing protein [Nitratireductor sp. CAU 1489]|uniref:Helix-turn-helix domain-containing protein n=1 Tax=Nitratireductor arenosus TaxID=2682096 RepID=A0A844QEH5_9HYPH|nr:helix-turn-helix domain-containing protein [Nitratireductor arenosus]MVA97024.1 helix-turn-helix domain-containing protein [Nitratireductor arenosus]